MIIIIKTIPLTGKEVQGIKYAALSPTLNIDKI